MLTIRKKLAPTWFKPPGVEPAPEFLLAPLTSSQWLDVRNEVHMSPAGQITMTGKGALSALEYSVRDWRNVVDDRGESIEYGRKHLESLPTQLLFDLAIEIANRAVLSESERKNSSSPSTAH
jgi:hypothetical protein